MKTTITDKLSLVHSDIRGPVYEEALRMQNEGRKVLKLNTGNLASFGFELPLSIRRAIEENLDQAVAYCDMKGMPAAREAICAYYRDRGIDWVDEDRIFIGNGVSETVQMVTVSTLNYGDEILLPSPGYSLWTNCAYIAGAKPVFYHCSEENEWNPDPEEIRRLVTKKTKAILVINPNNPTGAVYSEEILKKIVQIARENQLLLFSDEIYDRLCLDGRRHTPLAKFAPDLVTVTFNGLSKSHVICGFRCGWAVISGPKEDCTALCDGLTRICSMRLCSNAIPQLAIPAALEDDAYTRALLVSGGRIYEQREAVCSTLEKIDGITFQKNKAAFYLFPKLDVEKFGITDDQQFALDLLHAKDLLIIPGQGFGWAKPDHFRIVMLPEKEILKKAMEDLGDFLSDYHQN